MPLVKSPLALLAPGFLLLLAIAGCQAPPPAPGATPPPPVELIAIGFDALPGWKQDHPAQALPAFLASCAHISGGAAQAQGNDPAAWKAACQAGRAVPRDNNTAARAFFESNFQPFAIAVGGIGAGLFTGYYEPEMRGAARPASGYQAPLLALPNDIVEADLGAFADDLKGRKITGRTDGKKFVPYYDRATIEHGALAGRNLELLWLANPIDAFFVQIQGSGRIRLPDDSVVRVTYAGQNGRAYVPIGRILIEQGAIPREQVSMQSIRTWLDAHPAEAASVMDRNPSFVFFRMLQAKADEGPPGASGAALTPMRSIAVDRAFIPMGAPVFVDTTDAIDGSKIQQLMVAQDTGGAIRGAIRADIFFGWTPEAEAHAGRMKQTGQQYLLLPRVSTN